MIVKIIPSGVGNLGFRSGRVPRITKKEALETADGRAVGCQSISE